MSASLVRATVRAVSKRKLQPTRAALTLTPSAVNKIKQLLKDKPEHVGLKVGVRTRGCNGLSYTLEYTKTKGDSDEEVVQDESFLTPVIFMKIPASTSVIPGSYVTASFPAHEQKKKMATLHWSQSVHRKESTANTFRNRNGLC
ncbi:iron-sulfur cluster assembly 1 homolog, mitochondrial isoform X3 [Mustela nigripes]|uniref:Iron-sulfur cluster assembly 1 homolog, mitochondrial n=1 Tax=Mustela putorius furo TaxID=9669 RepID=A0A8U0NKH2_MUSPF|nr:iron-sulfur cluster assembly 1 homolog, mitochondrial isoform X3 [Mustela putorius furo]XP_058998741.1 iron-sulfur cluster assembly 1 homolog, mitochondrial isoform X1 [Mustela lutreola]XP_059267727.1 iron-sulfur cluster assembly 1 homolog, mitochondrial isoform X3 [Mustela nigripes]